MEFQSQKFDLPRQDILCRRLEMTKKNERVAGKIILKDVIIEWAARAKNISLRPDDIEIEKNKQGKPYFLIKDFSSLRAADISVSHSAGTAIAAISLDNHKIGIDIENRRLHKASKRIGRAFTQDEIILAEEKCGGDLLSLWTAKEAAAKAYGSGILTSLSRWKIIAISDSEVKIEHQQKILTSTVYHNHAEIIAICKIPPPHQLSTSVGNEGITASTSLTEMRL